MTTAHSSGDWSALEGDPRDRLAAARQLARSPDPRAEAALRAALAREPIPWVQRALAEALSAVELVRQLQDRSSELGPSLELPRELQQLRADAVQETARALLHDITPLVGRARQAAQHELSEDSEVRRELEALYRVCGAIRRLAEATAVPEFEQQNLSEELGRIAAAEDARTECAVRASGTSQFVVTTDLGLLSLAFENVLRNAVEATERAGAVDGAPLGTVVVTWGRDDEGPWIAVIDRGPGLPADVDVFELGSSTKPGPAGFGLYTAREAMRSLGGDIQLQTHDSDPGITALLKLGRDV